MVIEFSDFINTNYEVVDYQHGASILKFSFPKEYDDLINLLSTFVLKKSDIITPGGRKSPIASQLDSFLYQKGWQEKKFDTKIGVDNTFKSIPTHMIDCFKNKIAIEVEWNNKDPFFDRDLNNFRLLHELEAVSVGIVITRAAELQKVFDDLGKGKSYGNSTTHMDKLKPRIYGKGSGGCPVIAFGIKASLYREEF